MSKLVCALLVSALIMTAAAYTGFAGDDETVMARYFYDSAEKTRILDQPFKLERMELKLRAALRLDPAFEPAYRDLASILLKLGRNDEAYKIIENWTKQFPESVEAQYNQLLVNLSAAKPEARMDLMTAFVKKHAEENSQDKPGSLYVANTMRDIASEEAHAGNLDKALALLSDALKIRPGMSALYFDMALIQHKNNSTDEAIQSLRSGFEYQPRSISGCWTAYKILYDLGYYSYAFRVLEKANAISEITGPSELEEFARLAWRLRKKEQCAEILKNLLYINPDKTHLRLLRGIVLLSLGDEKNAKSQLSVVETDLRLAAKKAQSADDKESLKIIYSELCVFFSLFQPDKRHLADAAKELENLGDSAEIFNAWLILSDEKGDMAKAAALLEKNKQDQSILAQLARIRTIDEKQAGEQLAALYKKAYDTYYALVIEKEMLRRKIPLPVFTEKSPAKETIQLIENALAPLPFTVDKIAECYLKSDVRESEYGEKIMMTVGLRSNSNKHGICISESGLISPHFSLSAKIEIKGKEIELADYAYFDLPDNYMLRAGSKIEIPVNIKTGLLGLYLDLDPNNAKELKIWVNIPSLLSNRITVVSKAAIGKLRREDWRKKIDSGTLPEKILAAMVILKLRSDIEIEAMAANLPKQPAYARAIIIEHFGNSLNDTANDAAVEALKDSAWCVKLNAIEAVAIQEPDEEEAIELINAHLKGDDDPLIRDAVSVYTKMLKEKLKASGGIAP